MARFAGWVQSCSCCLVEDWGKDDLGDRELCTHCVPMSGPQASSTSTKSALDIYKHAHCLVGSFRERPQIAPDRQAQHFHWTFSVPAASFVLFIAELLQALNSLFLPHAHLVISELKMPPLVIQTGCSTAQSWASWKSERHELIFSTCRISATKEIFSTFVTTSI